MEKLNPIIPCIRSNCNSSGRSSSGCTGNGFALLSHVLRKNKIGWKPVKYFTCIAAKDNPLIIITSFISKDNPLTIIPCIILKDNPSLSYCALRKLLGRKLGPGDVVSKLVSWQFSDQISDQISTVSKLVLVSTLQGVKRGCLKGKVKSSVMNQNWCFSTNPTDDRNKSSIKSIQNQSLRFVLKQKNIRKKKRSNTWTQLSRMMKQMSLAISFFFDLPFNNCT